MIVEEFLSEIPGAVCARGLDRIVTGFGTDSRTLKSGTVFVALDGRRSKGADFVASAVKAGASAIVADRKHGRKLNAWKDKIAVVLVPDPVAALAGCARFVRGRFQGPVVAVTGSNGKTTTRSLIAGLLSARYETHQTEKNFNNEIGVPLTIFGLKDRHEALVAECGISLPGEMARLAGILRPEIAVLTNIGPTHLAGLKSERGVMEEKSKLIEAAGRLAFTGYANPWLKELRKKAPKLLTVHPSDRKADRKFDSVEDLGLEGWNVRWRGVRMRTSLYGPANLENLVLALAVAEELGVTPRQAARVLPEIRTVAGRSDVLRNGRITVLDETYNANPASVGRSLDLLEGLKTGAEKFVVLGTMGELGRGSVSYHRALGVRLAGSPVDAVWLCGAAMKSALPALKASGKDVLWFADADRKKLSQAFVEKARSAGRRGASGIVALVKGSRSCGLDEVTMYAKKKLSLK